MAPSRRERGRRRPHTNHIRGRSPGRPEHIERTPALRSSKPSGKERPHTAVDDARRLDLVVEGRPSRFKKAAGIFRRRRPFRGIYGQWKIREVREILGDGVGPGTTFHRTARDTSLRPAWRAVPIRFSGCGRESRFYTLHCGTCLEHLKCAGAPSPGAFPERPSTTPYALSVGDRARR